MRRAYAFIVLSSAGVACFSVVDVVYFRDLGYSLAFIGLMTAAFNLAVSAAELPFAVLFDRYSNKLALQLGNLIRLGAFALFFANLDATTLVLAQVLAGVGVAAASGTSNALVVNEIQTRSADVMARAFGRISYLVAGAGIVGGVIGVAIYSFEPRGIWLAAIGFFIAAAIVIAGFADTRAEKDEQSWSHYARKAIRVIRTPNAVILVLVNASAIAPFLLWQIKFDTVSLTFLLLGYLTMNVAGVVGPLLMSRARIRVAHIAPVAVVNAAAAVLFGFAESPWLVAVSFAVHVMLHVVLVALVSGRFHATIDNSIRATAGSVISLFDSLVVAVLAPVVGWVGQQFGLTWALGISCATYGLVAVLVLATRSSSARNEEEGEQSDATEPA